MKTVKSYRKWDETFCKEVIAIMAKYPGNLRLGFEKCANILGGSPAGFRNAWYDSNRLLYKLRTENAIIMCVSCDVAIKNHKNISRLSIGNEDSTITEQISKTFFKKWMFKIKKFFSK